MLTIGLDVGITGALATLDETGAFRFLADLPITAHGAIKWVDGRALTRILLAASNGGRPARVMVEYMHAVPSISSDDRKRNVGGEFKKGTVLGSVLAVLQIAELPYDLVVPQRWKRALGLIMPKATYEEKKLASLELARLLFPNANLSRKRDNGRAEALLIAHYAFRLMARADLFGEKGGVAA